MPSANSAHVSSAPWKQQMPSTAHSHHHQERRACLSCDSPHCAALRSSLRPLPPASLQGKGAFPRMLRSAQRLLLLSGIRLFQLRIHNHEALTHLVPSNIFTSSGSP